MDIKDEKPIEPKKDDKAKQLPNDRFVYSRDHNRSLRQIKKSLLDRSQKDSTDKPENTNVKKEGKEEPKKEEVKKEQTPITPPINIEEITKKAKDEATKVAKETFEKEMQTILEKNKSIEDKQKEADELISIWDKEKRLPTDYKEIVTESLRISEAKFKQLQRQKDEQVKTEAEAKSKSELEQKQALQKSQEQRINDLNTQVGTDLDDLYTSNILPKPPEKYDENDEAQKQTDDLLKFGIDLNVKRHKDGLSPIDSLTKIYFFHYKPMIDAKGGNKKSTQPAGADAPISGAAAAKPKEQVKGYVYARDHKKSYRQILLDNLNRMRKS